MICSNDLATRVVCVVLLVGALGCSGDDDGGGPLTLTAAQSPAGSVGPRAVSVVAVDVTAADGSPRSGVDVEFRVDRGGGGLDEVSAAEPRTDERSVSMIVRTDGSGRAAVGWRAGIAPVLNRLVATVGRGDLSIETRVELAEPLNSEMFGDIPNFLRDEGFSMIRPDGSEMFLATTEDLAFVGDDRLLLGLSSGTSAVDGALIEMDPTGVATLVELSGDPLVGTLGVAIDRSGVLWVADPRRTEAGALLRIGPDGVVETVLTSDGEEDLFGPNYVAIGPDGKVYVSDPCRGVIFRYDPEAGVVDARSTTDVLLQGGANGLAFDASGENLYFATENVLLLCGLPGAGLTDPVAGLYRLPVSDSGFGDLEAIAEGVGLFGDGLAFDSEENLYVIFDTEALFMLEESAVWVMPAGETELIKFLAASDRVYANLAWGQGEFGEEDLYIALLAVDAFSLPVRGIERISLGITGQPLL